MAKGSLLALLGEAKDAVAAIPNVGQVYTYRQLTKSWDEAVVSFKHAADFRYWIVLPGTGESRFLNFQSDELVHAVEVHGMISQDADGENESVLEDLAEGVRSALSDAGNFPSANSGLASPAVVRDRFTMRLKGVRLRGVVVMARPVEEVARAAS